jgi:TonB family protein
VYLASQLTEISIRFPAYVQELQEFLLKQNLVVPSPDAIPQLATRLEADARFRADVGSLLRATLYRERERVGYEDLLAILVAAAAGTKADLKSGSDDAEIRALLRFVQQSRRAIFRVDGDEGSDSAAPEIRQSAPVEAKAEPAKPSIGPTAESIGEQPVLPEESGTVAAVQSGEAGDLVLPSSRTSELFAAHAERETPGWRRNPAWVVGLVCMLVGLGLGFALHRVVSAAETHVAARAAGFSSGPETAGSVAPNGPMASTAGMGNVAAQRPNRGAGEGITEAPVGTVQTAAARGDQTAVQAPPPLEGRSTPPPAAPPPVTSGKSSAMPVTVVKQVVTASSRAAAGSGDSAEGAPATAATKSFVSQGAAGTTAANVIFSPPPAYPAAAAAARVHGQVTVHAVVDPDGKVIYARAVSGPPLLRDAAEEAVQRWRYSPLLDNGKPIAVTTVAILDFRVAR